MGMMLKNIKNSMIPFKTTTEEGESGFSLRTSSSEPINITP